MSLCFGNKNRRRCQNRSFSDAECTENEAEMEMLPSERMSHHQTSVLKPPEAGGLAKRNYILKRISSSEGWLGVHLGLSSNAWQVLGSAPKIWDYSSGAEERPEAAVLLSRFRESLTAGTTKDPLEVELRERPVAAWWREWD